MYYVDWRSSTGQEVMAEAFEDDETFDIVLWVKAWSPKMNDGDEISIRKS